jgi:hypothetical protein
MADEIPLRFDKTNANIRCVVDLLPLGVRGLKALLIEHYQRFLTKEKGPVSQPRPLVMAVS